MAKRLTQTIIAATLGCVATQAAAEMLPDPTRPPLEAGYAATGAIPLLDAGPVLQSVKIAPGRRSAVISGQLLLQGARFGEMKLVSISESEVVLLGPDGRQTLRLFPGVEKHVAFPPRGKPLTPAKNKLKRKTEQKAS